MIGQAMANGHLNKIIFLPGALEMVSKETSLDPRVAVTTFSRRGLANLVNITQHFQNYTNF